MEWTRHKIPKIKDVLPIVNGIFAHCQYTFKYDISKEQLDFLLLAKIGQRVPAPVIDVLHEQNEEELDAMLSSSELDILAQLMVMQYKQKWDKLGEIYDIDYDPIHNYLDQWEDQNDGTSERSRTEGVDRVDTLGTTVNKSSTRTDNLSETRTNRGHDTSELTDDFDIDTTYGKTNTRTDDYDIKHKGDQVTTTTNDTTVNSLWGFNSAADVNSDKSVNNGQVRRDDNLTEEHDGTCTDALSGHDLEEHDGTHTTVTTYNSDVTTANTGTQGVVASEATTGTNRRDLDTTESEGVEDSRSRSGVHTGNIGNLTSQKQILEEIELWKWNYVEQILDDAKDFLSLSVYC